MVKEGTSGAFQYFFPYTDHLGSILTVTSDNGSIVAEQNFDAWGRKRNVNTWDYANIAPVPDWLYRGFTGHEHLPEFGLINMNARLYDPVLGRMLSPDNYVQNSEYTQNYNSYSYAYNNPLKNTDPSGNFIFSTFLGPAGAVIDYACWSAAIDFGMQLVSGKGQIDWAEVGGAFAGGLISGGLGLVAPSFQGANLTTRYFGKALTTAANAGVSALGGHFVQDAFDGGGINDSRDTYLKTFNNAFYSAGLFSFGVSVYDYVTWDRFSPDEKLDIVREHFHIQPNNEKYQLKYNPTIEDEAFIGKDGIINFGKTSLESKAVAYSTFTHENVHFVNNHYVQMNNGAITQAQGENLAYRTEILLARRNSPFREINWNIRMIDGSKMGGYYLNDNLVPKNVIRASHIFFNIIR